MTFTLNLISEKNHDSVRALLKDWQVPKVWQHELRVNHGVLINGAYRYFNEPVKKGEAVTLSFDARVEEHYKEDDGPLTVVHDEAQFLIVDKPAGLKTHPNLPDENGTLINRAAAFCAPAPVFITHRLDQATSGLVLFAKNPLSRALINRQLGDKSMTKVYQALVSPGIPDSGTIDLPIGDDEDDKRKRKVREDGLPALTHYRLLEHSKLGDRVELTLETGRTHQLRVHLAAIGHPIIGDPLYAPDNQAERMMLHATTLKLTRPLTGERLRFDSAPPF